MFEDAIGQLLKGIHDETMSLNTGQHDMIDIREADQESGGLIAVRGRYGDASC